MYVLLEFLSFVVFGVASFWAWVMFQVWIALQRNSCDLSLRIESVLLAKRVSVVIFARSSPAGDRVSLGFFFFLFVFGVYGCACPDLAL